MQESMASAGCSELCRPLWLMISCFMQKTTLFRSVLRSPCSKPYSGRVQENMVTSRAEQRPYLGCLQAAVRNCVSCLGLKDSNPNDLGKKPLDNGVTQGLHLPLKGI